MEKDKISEYIAKFYEKDKPEINLTPKIKESLAGAVQQYLKSDVLLDYNSFVDKFSQLLKSEKYVDFIFKRQPYIEAIDDSVKNAVARYFHAELPRYTPIMMCRVSNHPDDNYMYGVVAKATNGEYACWTDWNSSRNVLNRGHYSVSENEAIEILKEKFHDISGDKEKYGYENTLVDISSFVIKDNMEVDENIASTFEVGNTDQIDVNEMKIASRRHGR